VQITLNGEPRELPDPAEPADVLRLLGLAPGARGLALAIDGAVVPRSAWDGLRLADGQRVEVLTAAQGG